MNGADFSEDKFAIFPEHVQDLVDNSINALDAKKMLYRNAALSQLTSWLEVDDHAVELICCEWTGQNGATLDWMQNHLQNHLAEEEWKVAPPERLTHMRAVIQRAFDGDREVLGYEYPVHIAVPIRARTGRTAVLGFRFAAEGWREPQPFDWDGIFAQLEDYRAWLLNEHGLLTCIEQWDALPAETKLKVWEE